MSSESYPIIRELDGIYIRVKREHGYHSLSFSDLTNDEQQLFLNRLDREGLQRMCKLLVGDLRAIGDKLNIVRVEDSRYERDPEQSEEIYENPLSNKFGRRLPYQGNTYLLGGIGGKKAFFDNCFCVPVNYYDDQIKAA